MRGDCAACAARSVVDTEPPFRPRSAANGTQFQGASPATTGWTNPAHSGFNMLSMAAHARFVLDLNVVLFRVRGWDDIITFAMTLLKAVPKARVIQALFRNLRHVGRELCAGEFGVPTSFVEWIFWQMKRRPTSA